ncbi:recombinase family protein [Thiocapsa sp.]|jgi:DNA invertase Pin-like site-specific DNA recombinase|uniref:recombinase family protein n=1 Tax=Thiocapsa sp. TaxID=2024551 RepID=UPI0035943985
MSGKAIGYLRVSTTDQTTARQLDGVELDRVFEDQVSGSSAMNRPALIQCLDYLRDGDVLHVHSIDRLARNLLDLQKLVEELTRRGVTVHFHKERLVFTGDDGDPMQTLMFQMMGAFAQFERALIRSRQREGIAAAKAAGKHLGRRSALTGEQIEEARARREAGESMSALAKAYGVSRQTLYVHLGGQA